MYFLASREEVCAYSAALPGRGPPKDEAPKKARLPGPERLAHVPHRGARNISFDAGA